MKQLIILALFFASTLLYSQAEPSWIRSFPYSPSYYTGIGSSNSGNKSDDYERALIQARLNLASEISTNITAETSVVTTDSTEGGFSESFSEELSQSVEQNLKDLEIVDTWYSPEQGYWVYVRLEKSRWSRIRDEESSALLERIRQLIGEDYFAGGSTTADRLYKLGSAASVLDQSPFGTVITGNLADKFRGNIFDFIQSEVYRHSSAVTLQVAEYSPSVERGEPAELRINCRSNDFYTGKIPLLLINSNGKRREILTDINGTARLSLNDSFLDTSKNRIDIAMDPLKFGFPPDSVYLNQFFSDKILLEITVSSSAAFLQIESNKEGLAYIRNPLSSLFSANSSGNFQMTDQREKATYLISFALAFTDYPRVLENAPLIAGLTGHISLSRGNRILYEYRTPSFKDGGLTYEQAYERSFRKMMDYLTDTPDFLVGIDNAMDQ